MATVQIYYPTNRDTDFMASGHPDEDSAKKWIEDSIMPNYRGQWYIKATDVRLPQITVTPEERYAAEDALRRLRDLKAWDECQPITLIETVVDAINWKRAQT